ncbi:MAG: hypothetical protein HY820_39425 [Acidobacteria bacterium]|nr:hypothetical protein [Acidobacteriota bacterium]
MKCLHCGKKLALLRKLTDREFCSAAHRRVYEQNQDKLALSRLREAQKHLVGFAKPEEPKIGPPIIPPVDFSNRQESEIGGFLAQSPDPIPLTGHMYIDCGGEMRVLREVLPERELPGAVYPPPSLANAWSPTPRPIQIPPRSCAEPAIGFSWVPSHPAGPAMRLECRGVYQASSIEWNVSPAPVAPVTAAIDAATAGPITKSPIIAVPYIALDRLPEILTPGPAAVSQPAKATKQMKPAPAPQSEPFQRRPAVARRNDLNIVDDRELPKPAAQPGDEPAFADLVAYPEPGIAERNSAVRRVRPRELFFPLPRLGHLPSLAAQVAGNSVHAPKYQGTRGKRWIPDRLPMSFRLAVADNGRGRGATPFDALAFHEGTQPSIVTRTGYVTGAELPHADETAISYLLAAEAPPPIHQRHPLVEVLAAIPTNPGIPSSRITMAPPAICWPALRHDEIRMARAGVPMQAMLPDAEAAVVPKPLFTGTIGQVGACDASHLVSATVELVQIKLSVPSAGRPICHIEPELAEIAAIASGDKLSIDPHSTRAGQFQVAEENSVFPLDHHIAFSATYYAPSSGELAPLWAELPKLLPRTALTVLEDSEMREAARALSAEMAMRREQSWFSGFTFPHISLQVNRGDFKWLMMSVPVILLLGVYTLTEKGAPVGVSHLPPVDRQIVEEPENAPVETAASHVAAPQPEPIRRVPVLNPTQQASTHLKQRSPSKEPASGGLSKASASSNQVPSLTPASNPGVLAGIRQSILHRAAVSMNDDFRSGLADWEGKGEWSKHWEYDDAGFLKAGPLALYKPSAPLADYRMEFLGQIEKKSIAWVFRAANLENYHAVKVVLLNESPLPKAAIEHWTVIDGKESPHVRRPVPFQMLRDSFYRFRMDISGSAFTLSIQGQVADHWSDDRLKSGGIGFFSSKGERSRLRWVEVSHQYDFLGRVCAFLAPFGIQSKDPAVK